MLCASADPPHSPRPLPALSVFSLDSVNQMALDWAAGNWYFLDDSREMILLCSLRNGAQVGMTDDTRFFKGKNPCIVRKYRKTGFKPVF